MRHRPQDKTSCSHLLGRRDFLRLLGGAAVGAGVLSLPLPHWDVYAQTATDRPADRLLVLNLYGGVRSSAAFHASGEARYNPWGLLSGTGDLRLGRLLGDALDDARVAPGGRAETPLSDAAYTLGSAWGRARLPRLAEMSGAFSVLGTWNERRGDHVTSQIEETTGGTRNDPGLLTRVNMALSEATGQVDIPSFAINVAESVFFGGAPGPAAGYAPVGLANRNDLPGQSHLPPELLGRVGERWAGARAPFDRLDQRALSRLAGANRVLADAHAGQRRSESRLGERLAQPWLDADQADAAFGEVDLGGGAIPLTNGMLREVFRTGLGPDPDDPTGTSPLPEAMVYESPHAYDADNLALAIRLLQLGAPVVVVELENFDLHAGERDMGPARYRTLGRWWASLQWLLARLRDPADPSRAMLDRTLIATTSEFGRDPGRVGGFNDGEGSDHGNFASCYFLGHAIMGAGIPGGRVFGGVETDGAAAYDARRLEERYGTHDFLATLLHALGLQPNNPLWGFPDTGAPITRLWGAT